jgi:hypothetical protein
VPDRSLLQVGYLGSLKITSLFSSLSVPKGCRLVILLNADAFTTCSG